MNILHDSRSTHVLANTIVGVTVRGMIIKNEDGQERGTLSNDGNEKRRDRERERLRP